MSHQTEKQIVPDLSRMLLRYQLRIWDMNGGPFVFKQGLISSISLFPDSDDDMIITFTFRKLWSIHDSHESWTEEVSLTEFAVTLTNKGEFLKLLRHETCEVRSPFTGWIMMIPHGDEKAVSL
jgi:hypothetical protein